jgi:hypothetical protein
LPSSNPNKVCGFLIDILEIITEYVQLDSSNGSSTELLGGLNKGVSPHEGGTSKSVEIAPTSTPLTTRHVMTSSPSCTTQTKSINADADIVPTAINNGGATKEFGDTKQLNGLTTGITGLTGSSHSNKLPSPSSSNKLPSPSSSINDKSIEVMNALVLATADISSSIKELKEEAKCFTDSFRFLINTFSNAGQSLKPILEHCCVDDKRVRSREVSAEIMTEVIGHGITLFEGALNKGEPSPSSNEEREATKRIRDILWLGLSTLQRLNINDASAKRETVDKVDGQVQCSSESMEAESTELDLKDVGETSPELGKRKLVIIGENQSDSLEVEPAKKRLRSNSKPRSHCDS